MGTRLREDGSNIVQWNYNSSTTASPASASERKGLRQVGWRMGRQPSRAALGELRADDASIRQCLPQDTNHVGIRRGVTSTADGKYDEFRMNRGKQRIREFDGIHPAGKPPVVRVDENPGAEVLAILQQVAETNAVEIPRQQGKPRARDSYGDDDTDRVGANSRRRPVGTTRSLGRQVPAWPEDVEAYTSGELFGLPRDQSDLKLKRAALVGGIELVEQVVPELGVFRSIAVEINPIDGNLACCQYAHETTDVVCVGMRQVNGIDVGNLLFGKELGQCALSADVNDDNMRVVGNEHSAVPVSDIEETEVPTQRLTKSHCGSHSSKNRSRWLVAPVLTTAWKRRSGPTSSRISAGRLSLSIRIFVCASQAGTAA